MSQYKRPQGTEDITPKEIHKWHTVEALVRRMAESYGFRETRFPTFENTELFTRSVGETTDVVQKEMYTVRARESEFTLRPEGTAGAIRSMIQNGLLNDALPVKAYYLVSCFRHERPQAGRLREFHQFGVEMAGSRGPGSDAQIIDLAKSILDTAGLREIELHINSIGCKNCRPAYHKALQAYFEPHRAELCETCQTRLDKNPMRILDCKSPVCGAIAKEAPVLTDYLCADCAAHFEGLQKNLTALGIDYSVDPKIVRGLDYYTKTVFEFVTTSIGAQGTICGGGRYDGLIEELGGKPTPAMGFGMGLERLILTMEKQGIEFPQPESCDLYIAPMDEAAAEKALTLVQLCRSAGHYVETDMMDRGLKAQMKYADKIGAKYVLVLGSNELSSGEAALKEMQSGKKTAVSLDAQTFLEQFSDLLLSRLAE